MGFDFSERKGFEWMERRLAYRLALLGPVGRALIQSLLDAYKVGCEV